MRTYSPTKLGPPSRFLHNQEIRDEIVAKLESDWPGETKNWINTRVHLRDRLNLPREILSKSVPGPTLLSVDEEKPPPKTFNAELLDRPNFQLESVILPAVRPVLFIQDNDFGKAPIDYWNQRLAKARDFLKKSIPSVGRVELKDHDLYEWNGTAWLVRPNVAVTNRHVAKEFGYRQGSEWVFRRNARGRYMSAGIDFREEYNRPDQEELAVTGIIYIEEDDGPDIALIEIQSDDPRSHGLPLAASIENNTEVAVIGYPKYDSSVPDPDILLSIFDGVYDVKRISPGILTATSTKLLKHDCSTLGGNSGSAVIGLQRGEVVGLHFGGSYRISNFAVPSPVIVELLTKLGL